MGCDDAWEPEKKKIWQLTVTRYPETKLVHTYLKKLITWNTSSIISWLVPFKKYLPWKINMEPEHDGLEDDFPFQLGDF